jgi:hypothetical protein
MIFTIYFSFYTENVRNDILLYHFVRPSIMYIRLARIFEFMTEIEKLSFFMNTLRTIRNSFFSLIFTLYSVYILYIMIGVNCFGGLINSERINKMLELNTNTQF